MAAKTTLSRAKAWAARAGITQVTEITSLDRLGVPVYVSVRPQGAGTTVTYGKGLLPIDAQVGAYMEAIEYYFAEPHTNCVTTQWGTARDVVGADQRGDAILDFPPVFQAQVDLDAPLLLAIATDIERQTPALVPAELVYYPAPDVGQSLFGSSTNGLASGNSVLEATIHALAEVIERDIWSLEFIRDASGWVPPSSLPAIAQQIVERANQIGLQLVIRAVPNEYGLAFFAAFLFDPLHPTAKFFNGGWGCHTHREIALVRAICEVAQSRLAFIHGARAFVKPDPIPDGADAEVEYLRHLTAGIANPTVTLSYAEIPHVRFTGSLEDQWQILLERLRRVTDRPIYRVIYTPPEAPLQVVRLIVPTLEDYKEATLRVGHRFKAALDAHG